MAASNVVALSFPRTRRGKRRPASDCTARILAGPSLSPAQRAYLMRGLDQAGGKLPLFDREGQRYCERTVRSCIDQGWAEPWFRNPIKPDWLVCRLTSAGRDVLSR